MDPYSAEGELVNMHNAFHQGQFAKVIEFDTSSFSSGNELPAQVLKLRAHIALSQFDDAIAKTKNEKSIPDFAAIKTLAEYLKASGDTDEFVTAAQGFARSNKDNLTVQLCAGTVLANAGLIEEALSLLSQHQGSLDAVAFIIQIHLQQNRLDLAIKEAQRARKWAQDSLLVNIAESWVGLREGAEKYQQAFYVFEEMAQAPATQSVQSLVGQAISELHLGRLPEAEAAIKQAESLNVEDVHVLALKVVINTILGQDTARLKLRLGEVCRPNHQLLVDLNAKNEAFEEGLKKYNPKFEP